MRNRVLAAAGSAIVMTTVLAAACAGPPGGSEHVVLAVGGGFTQGQTATTADVMDLTFFPLQNLTGHVVRLRAVRLVSVPRYVRSIRVTAYRNPSMIGIGPFRGDINRHCRRQDPPYPVSDVTVAAHGYASLWVVVIAVTFRRPGTYDFRRAKVYYVTDGRRGWQYETLNTTINVRRAAKGTKPAFQGCILPKIPSGLPYCDGPGHLV